jgi:hypothetical protein
MLDGLGAKGNNACMSCYCDNVWPAEGLKRRRLMRANAQKRVFAFSNVRFWG